MDGTPHAVITLTIHYDHVNWCLTSSNEANGVHWSGHVGLMALVSHARATTRGSRQSEMAHTALRWCQACTVSYHDS